MTMTTPLENNVVATYGDYLVRIFEDKSGYYVYNKKTGVIEIDDIKVLVQARAFAKDLYSHQLELDKDDKVPKLKSIN